MRISSQVPEVHACNHPGDIPRSNPAGAFCCCSPTDEQCRAVALHLRKIASKQALTMPDVTRLSNDALSPHGILLVYYLKTQA